MIAHVVLFEPRADLEDEARRELVEGLAAVAREIPSVRRCRVGRRVLLGGLAYEAAAPSFGYVAIVEVDDEAGLRAYLAHPAHQAIGAHFTASAASAIALDYALVDADQLEGLDRGEA